MTSLKQSPFYLLGATTRDDRRKIVELAEGKSLSLESDVCNKARSDLTTPRNRLSVEMAWLPGISPKRAHTLLNGLNNHVGWLKGETSIPVLANANLLAAAFEILDPAMDAGSWCGWIVDLASKVERILPEDVLREINEDRSISGFPEVRDVAQIEAVLAERKRYYTDTIKSTLDKLELMKLVEVVTAVVSQTTQAGESHAPQLISELVDRYENEANRYLQPESENITKLTDAVRDAASKGEAAVKPIVERLIQLALKWDAIARPIQLSMKAQGLEHELSHQMAWGIRSLAVDLFNKHDMLDVSTRLNKNLKTLFSALPAVAERLDEDSEALGDIARKREEGQVLNPLHVLCETAINNSEKNPEMAEHEGARALRDGNSLISRFQASASSSVISEARNIIAATVMNCAIEYGNKTAKWDACVVLLEKSLELVSDSALRQKIGNNLETARRNAKNLLGLEPITAAPSLSTFNGVGFKLYGNTDYDQSSDSYMATYYFVLLFIPIFPIARYRVVTTPRGYSFLGKGPLRSMDIFHILVSLGIILTMFAH